MSYFNIGKDNQLTLIREKPFKLEREIQNLTEHNLHAIFDLQLVRSEFNIQKFRIDTLAYDNSSKAFVIVEYKRDRSYSVIDQGYAYLSLMLNNKADFILEYNENLDKTLQRDTVDWSQSRVIFISPSFTSYQQESINFKDLPIELWEIKRYSNNTVNYNQVQTDKAQETVKTISQKAKTIESVAKEIKVYTEEEHTEKASDDTKELYNTVKNAILNLGEMDVKPRKHYVALVAGSNVVDFCIQRNALKLWLNLFAGELDDPKGIARNVSNIGHWGNGDYEIRMENTDDLEYILSLVKQSLRKNGK